ncbi:unnamed protein product [Durusdinium trenchii]|uniref:alpha-1,3-mannosyl-glycoprotein 2-beta-N-acetylglucosaminyltransferase n=2 Tax=Durusdinium trenchii TaxID=1381693 RepID=A0ABP0RJI2_9DINO
MPVRTHGKKKTDKPAKAPKRRETGTAKQEDEQPKKKQSFRIGRLQLAVGGAAAIGAGGAYLFWTLLAPAVDLRPKTTRVVASEPKVGASSFTLAHMVPGCTMERGYANRHIIGPERFGVSSPKECMGYCRQSQCNCWSWKDDGFCRTGKAEKCTYIASEDDDRWMYGSCNPEQRTPAPVKVAPMPVPGPLVPSPVAAKFVPRPSPAPVSKQGQGEGVMPSTASPTQLASTELKPGAETVLPDTSKADSSVCPVLLITHQRAGYLQRALQSIFEHRVRPETNPVIASQDGDNADVRSVLQKYEATGQLKFLQFSPKTFMPTGYQRLCAHYGWAFSQIFDVLGYEQAIVLEEDLEIASDFFSYFQATLPLLRSDSNLFCVSAWNDNGKPELAQNSTAIYRSDFFPGLGWMLLRSFWSEVKKKWPKEYWDDFLRRTDIRLERQCLRPEVSRTHTFGEKGVSRGQYYKAHLVSNHLNEKPVDWTSMNLSHVATPAAFDAFLTQQVNAAKKFRFDELEKVAQFDQPVAIRYDDKQWKRVAHHFGLMEDDKAGIRRGSYKGVLPFTWHQQPAYLVRDWPMV